MLIPSRNYLSYIVCSVYPGIYLFIFWTKCFPKVGTMILWYYQTYPKVVWKVVHGLMNTIIKTKTEKALRKARVCCFCRAVYYNKNHVIPHSVIAAILDVILSILKRRKQQQYASQILQIQPLLKIIGKIVINCYQVNFALNGGHLGHNLKHLNLLNQNNFPF